MEYTPEQAQLILGHIPLFAPNFTTTQLICNGLYIMRKYGDCDVCALKFKPGKCLANRSFFPQIKSLLLIHNPELLV